jgi:septum formation protein
MTVHAPVFDLQRETCSNLIPGPVDRDLVLASTSVGLRRLLEVSGLVVRVAELDWEESNALRQVPWSMPGHDPADVAELAARTRIDSALARFPGALVIGAQRVVSIDGKLLETPRTLDAARDLLLEMRGRTHQLHSAVALAEEGRVTWSSVDTAQVAMRQLSAEFVGRYLAAAGREAVGSPGAYELDGVGLQLLDRIEGAFPDILGAPLFPLFQRLREIGFMVS